jgi:glycosyltransferase involved in cell wall biosynthesis
MINISIIIPHRNSFNKLIRLLNTIPETDTIEVIVVDDQSISTIVKKLQNYRFKNNITVIYSELNGGAGKARNIGLDKAAGDWVIFADSDDYFAHNAFKLTKEFLANKEDIIYFGVNSITELGNQSYRHLRYMILIENYLGDQKYENELKFHFLAPWAKMVRRELLEKYSIRFEEIISGEDNLFSLKAANNAKKLTATYNVLYIITESKNSLSTTFSKDHFNSKFNAAIGANQFLCSINQNKYQQSILYFLFRSYKFGLNYSIYVIRQLIKYRSNIFIGSKKIFNFKEVIERRG